MTQTTPAERVRRLVRKTFQMLGSRSNSQPRETLLIRSGTFCGYRFDRDGFHAVWFVDENEIKFYKTGGAVVLVLTPDDARDEEQKRAA